MPRVVIAGATGIFLNQVTFNYALDYTAAANVALILGAAPAFTAAFAVALGHERVRPVHWLALGVSLFGVALVVQGGAGLQGFSLKGDLLAIGAALTWAAYSVMLRPLFGRYSAMRLSTLMILVGAVLMAPLAAVQLAHQDFADIGALRWGALAYSTVFPLVVTNVLYFAALRRVGAARATLFMYLQPFLGALFAALLLERDHRRDPARRRRLHRRRRRARADVADAAPTRSLASRPTSSLRPNRPDRLSRGGGPGAVPRPRCPCRCRAPSFRRSRSQTAPRSPA